jgi:hypothetical protein
MERLKFTNNVDDALKILTEMRIYLTGAIDLRTDPLWITIGNLLIQQIQIMEIILILSAKVDQKIANLEGRLARVERVRV